MSGGRSILEKFGRLPVGEVLGVRAPLLRLGGNNMFSVSLLDAISPTYLKSATKIIDQRIHVLHYYYFS